MITIEKEVASIKINLITHSEPHWDETVALNLIRVFGTEEFVNRYAPEPERCLKIGIDDGPFDEHVQERTECAASLVAKALNVADKPELGHILKYTLRVDNTATAQPFDVALILKSLYGTYLSSIAPDEIAMIEWASQAFEAKLHDPLCSGDFSLQAIAFAILQQNPEQTERAFAWFEYGLIAKYCQQVDFESAVKEYLQKAEVEEITLNSSLQQAQRITLATIVSTNRQMQKAARSKSVDDKKADILIVKNPHSGRIAIFTDHKAKIWLGNVAWMLHVKEQGKTLIPITKREMEQIIQEGGVMPGGRWFFHPQGSIILNGGPTHPEIPITQLSLEEIKKTIKSDAEFSD